MASGRLTPVKGSSSSNVSDFLSANYTIQTNTGGLDTHFTYQPPNGCGWLLVAVTAVEAALAITYPHINPSVLSSQIIADCANQGVGYLEQGCSGGRVTDALQFMSTFSVPLATVYPDTSVTWGKNSAKTCNQSLLQLPWSDNNWIKASGFWSPLVMSEPLLMAAVTVQPVVVLLTIGMEFLSWNRIFLQRHLANNIKSGIITNIYPIYNNSVNWNGGIFTPFQIYVDPANTYLKYGTGGCYHEGDRYRLMEMLVVGYSTAGVVKLQHFWILQSTFGQSWGTYNYDFDNRAYSHQLVGDGNGCIKIKMTNDSIGPCNMYLHSANAPNLGFLHTPLPQNGRQPPALLMAPPPLSLPPKPPATMASMQMAQLLAVFRTVGPLEVTLNILSTWTATSYPCVPPIWYGVTCGSATNESLTAGAIVTGLNLAGIGLTGTLPSALSTLMLFQSLDMSSNFFTGTLAPSYSCLRHLAYLDLHGNLLGGMLPNSYSTLRQLRYLDLHNNPLSGQLPTSYSFLKSMSQLSYLDIGDYRYNSSIPPKLTHLNWGKQGKPYVLRIKRLRGLYYRGLFFMWAPP